MTGLDASWLKLRTLIEGSNSLQDKWEALRWLARHNLYFLCKGVLAYNRDLRDGEMSPRFHGPLCQELDTLVLPYGRRVDLWPRGHLKTTLITIGKSIQDYLQNPNVRILLASASIDGAVKNLRMVKYQFAGNPILRWLFPECIPDMKGDKWAETEVCLPRSRNLPESTFKCIGVGGHITGWHFDIIRKDDLIDEKTEKSPEVMESIIDWHLLTKNLLEGPHTGIDHLVGTRWSMGDLYEYVRRNEPEYVYKCVAAIDERGQPRWGERFPLEDVTDEQGNTRIGLLTMRTKDPYKFATQQMNDPRAEDIVEFHAKWLRYYSFVNQAMDIALEEAAA